MEIKTAKNIQKNLAIIMPAFNESDCISSVIEEWSKVTIECQGNLIILNDGSKDDTSNILNEQQAKYDWLTIIHKENSGHGQSCLVGYKYAAAENYEWVFQTDSDGQTLASEFKRIWDTRSESDFSFGYRPKRGDGFARFIISKILFIVIKLLTGVSVKDANVPFRLMKTKKLKEYLDKIPENMFLVNAFLTTCLEKHEVLARYPITFEPRKGGIPSISWKRFCLVGMKGSLEFLKFRKLI